MKSFVISTLPVVMIFLSIAMIVKGRLLQKKVDAIYDNDQLLFKKLFGDTEYCIKTRGIHGMDDDIFSKMSKVIRKKKNKNKVEKWIVFLHWLTMILIPVNVFLFLGAMVLK